MTWPEGHKYVGQWKDGKRHGQGTYTWPSGQKYVGQYKDGKYHGQGTMTWPEGQKYVGQWKDDVRAGEGTMAYADGHKYVGQWKDYKRNGKGTMTYPDGRKYVGQWKDGARDRDFAKEERSRKAAEAERLREKDKSRAGVLGLFFIIILVIFFLICAVIITRKQDKEDREKIDQEKLAAEKKFQEELVQKKLAEEKRIQEKVAQEKRADQELARKVAGLRRTEKLQLAQNVIRQVNLKEFHLAVSFYGEDERDSLLREENESLIDRYKKEIINALGSSDRTESKVWVDFFEEIKELGMSLLTKSLESESFKTMLEEKGSGPDNTGQSQKIEKNKSWDELKKEL